MKENEQIEYWAHMLDGIGRGETRLDESVPSRLPETLYHATPSRNAASIEKNGLVVGKKHRYGISRDVICLTNMKYAALDFMFDSAGSADGESFDPDDVTLFEIKTKDLDRSKLALDPNKKTPPDADPDETVFYLEYAGDIPPEKLKKVDFKEDDSDIEIDFDAFSGV